MSIDDPGDIPFQTGYIIVITTNQSEASQAVNGHIRGVGKLVSGLIAGQWFEFFPDFGESIQAGQDLVFRDGTDLRGFLLHVPEQQAIEYRTVAQGRRREVGYPSHCRNDGCNFSRFQVAQCIFDIQ